MAATHSCWPQYFNAVFLYVCQCQTRCLETFRCLPVAAWWLEVISKTPLSSLYVFTTAEILQNMLQASNHCKAAQLHCIQSTSIQLWDLCDEMCSPPKTMKTTITAGPIACAESGEGATDPTARPIEELTKLSKVSMPRNLANLQRNSIWRECASCRGLALVQLRLERCCAHLAVIP